MSTGTTVVGARVFDGREVQAETSVRFAGGLVTACAARDVTRDGDEVVDGTGRTLLPGLIDAHTHLLPGAPQQASTFGVTTELDMFSQPALVRRCKAEAAAARRGRRALQWDRRDRSRRPSVDDVRAVSHRDRPG